MTNNESKTKAQLIQELGTLQQRIAGLEEQLGLQGKDDVLRARVRSAEEALRENEERVRVLMDQAADALIIHDMEGLVVDVSQITTELLGFTRDELIGMPVWEVVETMPVGGATEWKEMVPGVSISDNCNWQRKDGSTFPVEARLRTFTLGDRQLICALGRDITERQEAENSLRESEERFRAFMENTADAFVVHDLQGQILDVNQMACESLGYSRDELLSMRLSDIYPPCPRDGAAEWRSMVPGVPVTVNAFHQRKDGTTFPVEASILTFDLRGTRVVLGIARDITERQAAEETQRELAVLEERNRLARELHDSVTQALYSASLMSEAGHRFARSGDLERSKHYLGRLGDTTQQALKEMRLLVYQLRPSVLEREGIVGALRQRLEAVEKRAGVEARLVFDGPLDVPAKLEEELYRISQEALNNSLKHATATSVTVRIVSQQEYVTLEIEDNGKGFNPEAVPDRGGLGLTSMVERAESIPGTLTINSKPGRGTKIQVTAKVRSEG